MAVSRRELMKKQLMERTKGQTERSKKGYSYFISPLPEEIKLFRPDKGDHFIDIIPYIAGPNDPDPEVKEGMHTHVLTVNVHTVGNDEDRKMLLCPSANYHKPCPICEDRTRLRKEGRDDDFVDKLRPRKREVYNVLCQDSEKELDKGVQVLEVSYFYMGKFIDPIVKGPVRPDRRGIETYINYSSPDADGKTIGFTVGVKSVKGIQFPDFKGHRFIDRDYIVPDEILDQAICLDSLLEIKSYDEIYEMYFGEKPGEGTPRKAEAANSPPSRAVKSRVFGKAKPETQSETSPEPDDPTVDDAPDVTDAAEGQCPAGGVFGEDLEQLADCATCEVTVYNACLELYESLETAAEEETAPEPEPEPAPVRRTLTKRPPLKSRS